MRAIKISKRLSRAMLLDHPYSVKAQLRFLLGARILSTRHGRQCFDHVVGRFRSGVARFSRIKSAFDDWTELREIKRLYDAWCEENSAKPVKTKMKNDLRRRK